MRKKHHTLSDKLDSNHSVATVLFFFFSDELSFNKCVLVGKCDGTYVMHWGAMKLQERVI